MRRDPPSSLCPPLPLRQARGEMRAEGVPEEVVEKLPAPEAFDIASGPIAFLSRPRRGAITCSTACLLAA